MLCYHTLIEISYKILKSGLNHYLVILFLVIADVYIKIIETYRM